MIIYSLLIEMINQMTPLGTTDDMSRSTGIFSGQIPSAFCNDVSIVMWWRNRVPHFVKMISKLSSTFRKNVKSVLIWHYQLETNGIGMKTWSCATIISFCWINFTRRYRQIKKSRQAAGFLILLLLNDSLNNRQSNYFTNWYGQVCIGFHGGVCLNKS